MNALEVTQELPTIPHMWFATFAALREGRWLEAKVLLATLPVLPGGFLPTSPYLKNCPAAWVRVLEPLILDWNAASDRALASKVRADYPEVMKQLSRTI